MPLEDFNDMLKEKEFSCLWNKLLSNYIIKKEIKELSFMKDSATKRYEMFLHDFPGLLNKIPHYYIVSYLATPVATGCTTLSNHKKNLKHDIYH